MADDAPDFLGSVMGDPVPAPAAAAPDASTGDPAVWTALGEAGTDPQGQLAVASVMANRTAKRGMSAQAMIADPAEGWQAWQDAQARAKTMAKYPVGSPEYNAAQARIEPIITGQTPAPYPFDIFHSAAIKQPWDANTKTVNVGGNVFGSGQYTPPTGAAPANPDLDALLGGPVASGATTAPANAPPLDADKAYAAAFGGLTPHTPSSGAPANAGDVAIRPNAQGVYTDPSGKTYTPATDLGTGYFRDAQGNKYQIDVASNAPVPIVHPGVAPAPSFPVGQSWVDRLGIGLDQGVRNVGIGIDRLGNWADQNVPGVNAFDQFVSPLMNSATAPNQLAADLAYRDRNDVRYAGSPAYNLGKFGGEAAVAVPVIAATEGAAAPAFEGTALGGATDALAGSRLGNLFLSGARGAAQGAEAGAVTSGGSDEPFLNQVEGGAATGGVLGPGGELVNAGARRLIAPAVAPVSDYIANLAAKANAYGIDLRGTQLAAAAERAQGVANGPAAIRDSELLKAPGSGYAPNQAAQKTAWNAAVAQNIGAPEGATNFSPEVMSTAKANTGAMFKRVAQNVNITDTDGLLTALGRVADDASQVVPETELTPLLRQIQNIASTINDGKISGDSYLALTRTNSPLDRLASGDGNAAFYGQQLKNVVDDFAQSTLSPEDAAEFAQAREYWRNMKAVEPLVAKSPGEYQISPLALLQRLASNPYTKTDLVYNGGGELGDLARIGHIVGDKASDSGSAARLSDMLKAAAGTGSLLAAPVELAGTLFGHGPEALPAATAAFLAPAAARLAQYGRNVMAGSRGMSSAYKAALLGAEQAEPGFMTPLNRFIGPAAIPSAVTYRNLFLPAPYEAPAGVPAG